MGISLPGQRPLSTLNNEEIQSYLEMHELPRLAPGPIPYSAQDLRLELARRQPASPRREGMTAPLGGDGALAIFPPSPTAPVPTTTPTLTPPDEATAAASRNSPAAHPPARARSGTAVVTPSAGSSVATPQPPPTQSPEQMAPPISLAPSQRQPPLEAEPGQRLMEFGLAMLASRSPYFGQTVGEAGQAVIAGDRTRRQENREQQKADTEQIYREGILRLEAAQQAWRQNPRNPEAVMNLARAQHYLASIETDRIRANAAATNASEAVRDRVVGQRPDSEGNMWNIFQSGRMERLRGDGGTDFRDTSNTPAARAHTNWYNNRAQAATRIATATPPLARAGDAEAWREEAWNDWLRRNPEPPNPDAARRPGNAPQRIRLPD